MKLFVAGSIIILFYNDEIKNQTVQETCPISHSYEVAQQRFEHSSLNPKTQAANYYLKELFWIEECRSDKLCGHCTRALDASIPEACHRFEDLSFQPSTWCPELILKGSFLK